jgi:integrase
VEKARVGIPGFILGIGGRKNGEIWKVAQINRLQKLERVKGIEPSLRFTQLKPQKSPVNAVNRPLLLELVILGFILGGMATVFRRGDSKYWVACFTSRDGRQLKRSTKTDDRNQAMQIAVELERVERQANAGDLVTTQLHKVLSEVAEKVTGETLNIPTVEAYFAQWLEGVRAKRSAGTAERYGNTVRLFLASLGRRAGKPITGVTSAHLDAFLTERLKAGIAPKTAIVDMKTLQSAFRRAEMYGMILKNPVVAVQLPKSDSSEREIFTQDEVQRILAAAPTLEWQTLIVLGYFLGARLGDCVSMKWENVHPAEGVIVYEQRKTGKKVVVPMHFHVIEHLNYIKTFGTNGFLCPTLATKGPGGKHGLSEGFKRIAKKAGIDIGEVQGKGAQKFCRRTFHSLRHSFNSILANAGISEELRMKLTGHSSKAMNARYTHLEVATLKTAITAVPLFGSQPARDAAAR